MFKLNGGNSFEVKKRELGLILFCYWGSDDREAGTLDPPIPPSKLMSDCVHGFLSCAALVNPFLQNLAKVKASHTQVLEEMEKLNEQLKEVYYIVYTILRNF